jgi:hypothetical protein
MSAAVKPFRMMLVYINFKPLGGEVNLGRGLLIKSKIITAEIISFDF